MSLKPNVILHKAISDGVKTVSEYKEYLNNNYASWEQVSHGEVRELFIINFLEDGILPKTLNVKDYVYSDYGEVAIEDVFSKAQLSGLGYFDNYNEEDFSKFSVLDVLKAIR